MSYFRLERRFQRPAAPLLALLALSLLLLLLLVVAAPAGAQVTGTNDYDTDDDRLIDIDSLAKLNAIRYDVNGDGLRGTVSSSDWTTNYLTAFPDPLSTQCPSGCQGYELTASLTFPSSGAYSSWSPLGTDASATRYNTTFHGRGHTLTDLSVTSNAEHVGLFGRLAAGAVIRDLGLINPTVSQSSGATNANQRLGALAGSANAGSTVSAVYVSGGSIISYSAQDSVGGLIGSSGANITASWSSATVTQSDPCGNCNSTDAGGLVGYHAGTITASYASGAVTMSGTALDLGGLAGYVSGAATRITNSYCNSTVMVVSGCVGSRSASANASLTTATAQTTTQLQTPVNYSGNYRAWNVDLDGDNTPDNPWQFGTTSEFPTLSTAAQRQTVVGDFDGDDDGLIEINTAAQLIEIGNDLNGNGDPTANAYADAFPGRWTHSSNRMGCPSGTCTGYELTADITLTAAWTPTGTYTATFDGGGHQISGLSVSHGGDSGMFGGLGGSAIVRDLRLNAPTIAQTGTNARSSGALVGYINTGTTILISSVSVEGGSVTTTSNNSNVGGLVGFIRSGSIQASWSSATAGVSGTPTTVDAGGLAGDLGGGSVIASYARGAASGGANNGGFAGRVSATTAAITNSYCVGASGNCDGTVVSGGPTATRQTVSQIQTPTDYTGIFTHWNVDVDGDNVPDYRWNFGTSSEYPTLNTPTQRTAAVPAAMDYDADDNGLIDISTAAQLNAIRWDLNGDGVPSATGATAYSTIFAGRQHTADATSGRMGCPLSGCNGYELLADLTLGAWTPTGGWDSTFDGGGHTISDATITRGATAGDAGFFGFLTANARVRDVGLVNFTVTSSTSSAQSNGILAGFITAGATITNVYASGGSITVSVDTSNAGGLVGRLHGTLTASYSTAAVTASGTATTLYIGGLAGRRDGGTITASYAAGTITDTASNADANVGGLVGRSDGSGGGIVNSYCLTSASHDCLGTVVAGTLAVTAAEHSAADLQAPTDYAGLYLNWNVDQGRRQRPGLPLAVRHFQRLPDAEHPIGARHGHPGRYRLRRHRQRPHRHQHGGAIERRPVGLERRRRPGGGQQQRLRHGLWRPAAHRRRRRRSDGLPPNRLHRLRTAGQPDAHGRLDAPAQLHRHFRRPGLHHQRAEHHQQQRQYRAVRPGRRQRPAPECGPGQPLRHRLRRQSKCWRAGWADCRHRRHRYQLCGQRHGHHLRNQRHCRRVGGSERRPDSGQLLHRRRNPLRRSRQHPPGRTGGVWPDQRNRCQLRRRAGDRGHRHGRQCRRAGRRLRRHRRSHYRQLLRHHRRDADQLHRRYPEQLPGHRRRPPDGRFAVAHRLQTASI